MNHIKNLIQINVKESFSILHMSDTHLTLADERDCKEKIALSERRSKSFPNSLNDSIYVENYVKEKNLPLFHTGDLIDFTSTANFERGANFINNTGCLLSVGNHEFSQYVGEAHENEEYKSYSTPDVLKMISRDSFFASKIINGVNFVAFDNSYYTFNLQQIDELKAEIAKGYPIVLLLHNPLYEQKLYDIMMKNESCAYLVDVPEKMMKNYSPDRYIQQLADEATHKFVSFVKSQESVKLILAGHIHFDYEGIFDNKIPQLITGKESLREITFI